MDAHLPTSRRSRGRPEWSHTRTRIPTKVGNAVDPGKGVTRTKYDENAGTSDTCPLPKLLIGVLQEAFCKHPSGRTDGDGRDRLKNLVAG